MTSINRHSPFLHLAWKEYRTLRGLWLACAVVTAFLQAVSAALPEYLPNLWLMAILVPGCFAIGAGAISFAAESENGTDDLLRMWSPPYWVVLAGKLGVAAVSTITLFGTLYAVASILSSDGLPASRVLERQISNIVPMGLGLFAITILTSLLVKRTLNAIWLAAVAWMILLFACGTMWNDYIQGPPYDVDISTNVLYLTCIVFVLLGDFLVARRWVQGRPVAPEAFLDRLWVWPFSRVMTRSKRIANVRRQPFRHLFWRELRIVRFSLFLIIGTELAYVFWYLVFKPERNLDELVIVAPKLGGLLLGVGAFHHERRGNTFRFLSERGVSPLALWASKQFVRVPIVMINAIAILLFVLVAKGRSIDDLSWLLIFSVMFMGLAFLAYASGLLAGILFPSAILAAFFGFFIMFYLAWSDLMEELELIPIWWFLAVLLLVATLIRTQDLLNERYGWRAMKRVTLCILPGTLVLFAGFAFYRAVQIPVKDVQIAPFSITPAATETATIYRQALEQIKPLPKKPPGVVDDDHDNREEDRDWLANNESAVALALEAAERPDCEFYDPNHVNPLEGSSLPDVNQFRQLADLVLLSAKELQEEGRLDEALDRYAAVLRMARHIAQAGNHWQWGIGQSIEEKVRNGLSSWSGAEGQTADRIRRAIAVIEEQLVSFPSLSRAWEAEFVSWQQFLSGPNNTIILAPGAPSPVAAVMRGVSQLMPWEKERSLRLLRWVYDWQLSLTKSVEEQLTNLDGTSRGSDSNIEVWDEVFLWARPTRYGNKIATLDNPLDSLRNRAANLRGLLLVLALQGHKLEDGAYPERLSELVGPWLKEMPIDPFSGQKFGYEPSGFPAAVTLERSPDIEVIPPRRALLWSAGPRGLVIIATATPEGTTYTVDGRDWLSQRDLHDGSINRYLFLLSQVNGNKRN